MLDRYPVTHLSPRGAQPEPVVLNANSWNGNDGYWSTFTLQIGPPYQTFQLLPFISTSEIAVPINSPYCGNNIAGGGCAISRGLNVSNSGYLTNLSTVEIMLGASNLTLPPDFTTLTSIPTQYLLDDVQFPSVQSRSTQQGILPLRQQIIGAYSDIEFWLGGFGLGVDSGSKRGVNYTSLLVSMKDGKDIPSLSFGYQMGSYYRGIGAQLILGGYDAVALGDDAISWAISSQPSLDLAAMVIGGANLTNRIPLSIDASLDSTTAYIWLPSSACDSVASVLSLQYNSTDGFYYPLNETTHDRLQTSNISMRFIFNGESLGENDGTLQVTIPYAALDLDLSYPHTSEGKKPYFPMRKSSSETQAVFGRAFLQEVYMVVDWERQNLTIGQAQFTTSGLSVTAIPPLNSLVPSKNSHVRLIVGLSISAAVVFLILVSTIRLSMLRRRKRAASLEMSEKDQGSPEKHANWAELFSADINELPLNEAPQLAMSKEIYELHRDGMKHQPMSNELFELP